MSKLIITPSSIEEILLYKDADCYLLGNEAFSVRYNHCFNADELRKAKERENKRILKEDRERRHEEYVAKEKAKKQRLKEEKKRQKEEQKRLKKEQKQ